MELFGIIQMEDMTSVFSDTAEVTVPCTDPIPQQLVQQTPQVGGAVGGAVSQTGGSVFSPIPHARVPVNTQNTEYTEYRVPVSLPVPQNVVVQRNPQEVVHQTPQAGGAVGGMISTIGGAASQTRGSVFSPIPQTAGHSVSLPVLHNAIVQHVPQQLVQISQNKGTAVQ